MCIFIEISNNMRTLLSLLFQFYLFQFYAQPLNSWSDEKIMVKTAADISVIMNAELIFKERWDQLPQIQFWKKIMLLTPDSCLINIASSRVILKKICFKEWMLQSDIEKEKTYKGALEKKKKIKLFYIKIW